MTQKQIELTPLEESLVSAILNKEGQSAYSIAQVVGRSQPSIRTALLRLESRQIVIEDALLKQKPQDPGAWLIHPAVREALGLAPLDLTHNAELEITLREGPEDRRAHFKRMWKEQRTEAQSRALRGVVLPVCTFCGVRHCSRRAPRKRKLR